MVCPNCGIDPGKVTSGACACPRVYLTFPGGVSALDEKPPPCPSCEALRSQLAEARRLAESRLGTFREMVADRDTWADRAKSAGWPGVGVRWDADAVLRDLRRELAEARETNVRLNRRCQAYEAGLKEKIGGGGRGFGRMLANAAATMEKARADAAEKDLAEARQEIERLTRERAEARMRTETQGGA